MLPTVSDSDGHAPVTLATVPFMLTVELVGVVDVTVSSVAVVPLTVTPIWMRSSLPTMPIDTVALTPGPEKPSTTWLGGTFVSVKLPSAPTAADTLVPTTVTMTPVTPSVCARAADPIDPPDTVPTIVAPPGAGVGDAAAAAGVALLGAAGEPLPPQAVAAARRRASIVVRMSLSHLPGVSLRRATGMPLRREGSTLVESVV